MRSVSEQFIQLTRATSHLLMDQVHSLPEITIAQLKPVLIRTLLLIIPVWFGFLGFAALVVASVLRLSSYFELSYEASATCVGLFLIIASGISFSLIYKRISQ